MAVPCEFGNSLSESLKDCLVCGLRDEAHQKRLLSEPELTLDKAQMICQSLETAELNTQTLWGSDPMLKNYLRIDARGCMHSLSDEERPLLTTHNASRNVSVVGDLTMCQPTVGLQSTCAISATRKIIWPGCVAPISMLAGMDVGCKGTSTPVDLSRSRIGGGAALVSPGTHKASPIMVNVQVNGVPLSMELDTGAHLQLQLQPFKDILCTYTAQNVGVAGTLPVKVVCEEQEKDLSLFIVQGRSLHYLNRIGLPASS